MYSSQLGAIFWILSVYICLQVSNSELYYDPRSLFIVQQPSSCLQLQPVLRIILCRLLIGLCWSGRRLFYLCFLLTICVLIDSLLVFCLWGLFLYHIGCCGSNCLYQVVMYLLYYSMEPRLDNILDVVKM